MASVPDLQPRVHVLVADSDSMSCRLLADALQRTNLYQASAAVSIQEMSSLLQDTPVNVLLLGAGSVRGQAGGLGLLRQIRERHPQLEIVLMLDSLDRALVVEAFRCGASGIFLRADSFQSLCKCIQRVHEGQVWAASSELEYVLDALAGSGHLSSDNFARSCLSKREEEIARLVSQGLSNRQISQKLMLSEHTVKNYLFRIFEKLGVSTRVELAVYALTRKPEASPEKRVRR